VPELADVIAQADLYVLPMRLGSGIRSKLWEVFPLGVPIVTTSIGAEGLALIHNDNCLVADTAIEFARACIQLLGSPQERRRLGRNAHRLADETYSKHAVRQRVQELLGWLLAAPWPAETRGPASPAAEARGVFRMEYRPGVPKLGDTNNV
jgi:glycosyltransferase involved in cell wall biosynthesis